MIKKIFFIAIFLVFINILCPVNSVFSAPKVKPLQIETPAQNDYKYGEFAKISEDENNNSLHEALKQTPKREKSVLDIFNALIFVVVLILLTGWIYMKIKRINPQQLLSGKFNSLGENNFRILSSLQLGGGKAIYLIEINDKQLIVGTTSSSVTLLAQMDKIQKTQENVEIPDSCIEKLFQDKTEEFKKLED